MLDYTSPVAAEDKDLLSQLFDLSLLKFQQRDEVAATLRKYSRKVGWLLGFQAIIAVHVMSSDGFMLVLWPISLDTCFACFSSLTRLWCMQVIYDMQKAWDARSRKFYASRYDYRRNAVG